MLLPELYVSLVLCSFKFLISSQGSFVIQQDDVSISYLPLAHMFERMIQVWRLFLDFFFFLLCLCVNLTLSQFVLQVSMFCHGARVGFYQGDISLLMDDIKTLKPTFFPVVPRLLNRIYDKVRNAFRSCNLHSTEKATFLVGHVLNKYVITDFCEDPGFCDLSVATGFASLRCEEEAGRASKRDCTQQQPVGQTGLQQDSGQLLTALFLCLSRSYFPTLLLFEFLLTVCCKIVFFIALYCSVVHSYVGCLLISHWS